MALRRCTCIATLQPPSCPVSLMVSVPDPFCEYHAPREAQNEAHEGPRS